jgi:hypothetical protein
MNARSRTILTLAIAAAFIVAIGGCVSLNPDHFMPESIGPAGNDRRFDGSIDVQAFVPKISRGKVALFDSDMLRVALEKAIVQKGLFQRIERGDADYVLDVGIEDATNKKIYLGEGYVIDLSATWSLIRAKDGKAIVCDSTKGHGASHAVGTNAYVAALEAAMREMIQKGLIKLSDQSDIHQLPTTCVLKTMAAGSYAAAMTENSIDACRAYLVRFPAGRHRLEVNAKLEELLFRDANSIQACRQFLSAYPQGRFSSEARTKLDALSFQQAAGTDTVAAYRQYLTDFPDGKSRAKAQWKIEYMPMQEAWLKGDSGRLDEFLRSGRSFAKSEEAASRLMEILMQKEDQYNTIIIRLPGIPTQYDKKESRSFAEFRLLLRAGTNPDLVRLNDDKIVPASQGGMTALEFIDANQLKAYKNALLSQGADR